MKKIKKILLLCASIVCIASKTSAALGITNGTLSPCNNAWNCAITQEVNGKKPNSEPIYYSVDHKSAFAQIKKIIMAMPRVTLIQKTDEYLHFTCASTFFGFIDDLECYLPKNENIIYMRSAARSGIYDFGVNKNRIRTITKRFKSLKNK